MISKWPRGVGDSGNDWEQLLEERKQLWPERTEIPLTVGWRGGTRIIEFIECTDEYVRWFDFDIALLYHQLAYDIFVEATKHVSN